MSKEKLFKAFLVAILGIVMIWSTNVFAVDLDDEEEDGDDEISDVLLSDNDVNSTPTQGNLAVKETNVVNNTVNNTTTNNTTNNTASVYNNTNTPNSLSKAGIEDSIPTVVLIAIFGISAVYAYKKMNDYKNI